MRASTRRADRPGAVEPPLHARQRRRIVGEAVERRAEARLQRNASLALDELVGEVDDRAFVEATGVEGEIHMARDRRGHLGKSELAQQRGARLGVAPAALGDVVNQRRGARQVRIDRFARRLQPPRQSRRQRGDGAAMAARRFGRRRRVEHGLAFRDVRHAMPGQRRREQAIVVAPIHVDQASPVENSDFARRVFMARRAAPAGRRRRRWLRISANRARRTSGGWPRLPRNVG